MESTPAWKVFFQLHSGNPREGPGDKAFTLRALEKLALLNADKIVAAAKAVSYKD